MSIETKKRLKGAVAMTAIAGGAITIIVGLIGAIFMNFDTRITDTQAKVESQATVIQSVKSDTVWIKTYLCSRDKSANCPIPTN